MPEGARTPPRMPGGREATVGFVLLVSALMSMGAMTIDVNLPAIPAVAAELDSSLASAQLTVTSFFTGFALGQIVIGPLSDRYGRKPVLLWGIGLFVLASLACLAATDIATLLLLRLLQGLAGATGPILSRAVVRDLFEGAVMARVMSFVMAAFITAPIVAPAIGAGLLALGSWRWIFAFLALYGLAMLAWTALGLEETRRFADPDALRPRRILGGYRALLGHRRSRRYALVTVLTFVTLIVYLTNVPVIYMDLFGVGPGTFAAMFGLTAACAAAGSLVNARLVRFLSLARVIALGSAGAFASGLLNLGVALLDPPSVWLLVPGFGAFFFSFSLIVSNSTALALQPHGRMVGGVVSALGVLQTFVPAVIGSLLAAFYAGSAVPTLLVMALLPAVGLLLAEERSGRGS